MQSIREMCATLWHHLNPSEPGPYYLATFFGTAIVLFIIAYLIGLA